MFKALVLNKQDNAVTAAVEDVDEARLPEGDVTIAVEYSTLNYKDGLIIGNKAALVRTYPHVPGIDFAGRVLESASRLASGRRRGADRLGRRRAPLGRPRPARPGQGRLARRCPRAGARSTPWRSAPRASRRCLPCSRSRTMGSGPARRRGSGHGRRRVGSVAVAVLAKLGHQVTASTGRATSHDYLRSLGATAFIDRAELAEPSSRPLESERFAGCIDAVGGTTLARVLAQMKYRCSVAAVGLAGGSEPAPR